MTTPTERTEKTRNVFTHQDVVNMTLAYKEGGRQAVYKLVPHIRNDVVDAKLIELGIMPKPERPTLAPELRNNVVGEILTLLEERVPKEHQAEAARGTMLALRERFLPKARANGAK